MNNFKIKLSFKKNLILYFILTFISCVCIYQPASASNKKILSLIGKRDSLMVTGPEDKIVYSKNADKKRIPASILKLVTSLTAFYYLGEDFRFITEFYIDKEQNLKIKGYGDPVLVSEEIEKIASELIKKHTDFGRIILDNTYFDSSLKIPGITKSYNPYDACNGALSVNFNTVCFQRNTKHRLISAEPHTPLLPFIKNKITARIPQGRVSLLKNQNDITLYTGYLLEYFLKQQGANIKGAVKLGKINKEDKLIYSHKSSITLKEIVYDLLQYSSNFIANQLLIAIGAKIFDPPGSPEKGLWAVKSYIKNIVGIKNLQIFEGSGISKKNKISCMDMMKILKEFRPYKDLLVKDKRLLYKTGTLSGVRTRAGYIKGKDDKLYNFVVMINTNGKTYNKIIRRLLKGL
ncbi:serine-type D-Ala-D-Ala carboxypeptidase/endopeptidase (penicillin-binding protein 4) [Candidatus Magnetomoraceae bacterium gMMP-15]